MRVDDTQSKATSKPRYETRTLFLGTRLCIQKRRESESRTAVVVGLQGRIAGVGQIAEKQRYKKVYAKSSARRCNESNRMCKRQDCDHSGDYQ